MESCWEGEGGTTAAIILLRTPELTSPIFLFMAVGLKGGVRRRSERVVV